MIHDPISDMLTRIRNAVRIERPFVDVPLSRLRVGVADVLKREGYIWDFAEIEAEQALVNANRELIERFEKKIQTVLNRIWGN